MKSFKVALFLSCALFTNILCAAGGPNHIIENNTNMPMRLEGRNARNNADLYFSELTKPHEIIGFQAGSGYPDLTIVAKMPEGDKVLAKTEELPNSETIVTLENSGDSYSFSVRKK